MSRQALPLRDRLPSIDQAVAERQTRLIAALNARRLGDRTLTARLALAAERRTAAGWVSFRAGERHVAIAPLLVDGEPIRLTGQGAGFDPAIAAQLLAAIEPIVAALEHALGVDLHPEGLVGEPPADALLLRLEATCPRQAIRHRLIVAVPPDGSVTASALPPAKSALLAALRARWTASIDIPPLPVIHFGTIGVGDLYLLGLAPLVARVTLPGHRGAVSGRLEPMNGSMILQDEIVPASPGPVAESPPSAMAAGDGAVDWTLVTVPATIEIEGGLLSARDVVGLAPGSVLPLPRTGGTLTVRVTAGGTVIGTGELVAVGDGFGVLFTSVTDAPDAEG